MAKRIVVLEDESTRAGWFKRLAYAEGADLDIFTDSKSFIEFLEEFKGNIESGVAIADDLRSIYLDHDLGCVDYGNGRDVTRYFAKEKDFWAPLFKESKCRIFVHSMNVVEAPNMLRELKENGYSAYRRMFMNLMDEIKAIEKQALKK